MDQTEDNLLSRNMDSRLFGLMLAVIVIVWLLIWGWVLRDKGEGFLDFIDYVIEVFKVIKELFTYK